MQTPLQIVFRGMETSEAVKNNIEERVEKLEKIFDRIISCRVVVELPHRHQSKGKLFNITIDLSVPGDVIVVNRAPSEDHALEDIYVAIKDAFNTARRQLEDYIRRRRKDVKTHEETPKAQVVKLLPEQDCGFIETRDGREIYFHRNSVLDGFESLTIGSEVRYVEKKGDEGPQASTIALV